MDTIDNTLLRTLVLHARGEMDESVARQSIETSIEEHSLTPKMIAAAAVSVLATAENADPRVAARGGRLVLFAARRADSGPDTLALAEEIHGRTLCCLDLEEYPDSRSSSLPHFTTALELYEQAADHRGILRVLIARGTAYLEFEPSADRNASLQAAIADFEQVLSITSEQEDPDAHAKALNNIGCALLNLQGGDRRQQLRAAHRSLKKALAIRLRNKQQDKVAIVKTNIQRVLVGLQSQL